MFHYSPPRIYALARADQVLVPPGKRRSEEAANRESQRGVPVSLQLNPLDSLEI
jgi:hypothetical protein